MRHNIQTPYSGGLSSNTLKSSIKKRRQGFLKQVSFHYVFSIVNDPTVDWTVRHGHAIALSAVLHDAVERIVAQGLYQVVTDAAVEHATTDRVSA